MKEFLRGLYPRDCLGPRPKRTKMNHLTNLAAAFFEQKHHRTASNNNQSTIGDSIWLSNLLVGSHLTSAVSFHRVGFAPQALVPSIPNKYARTHFKEETCVENQYPYVPFKHLLWMHVDRNETHWSGLLFSLSPSPTIIHQAFLWYQNSWSKMSYTSLSPSTIQPRTLSHYYLLLLKGTFCHFFQHFPGQICSIASDPIHKNAWTETSRFGRFQHGRPTMHLFPMSSCSASSIQHAIVQYRRNVSKRMWKSRPKS